MKVDLNGPQGSDFSEITSSQQAQAGKLRPAAAEANAAIGEDTTNLLSTQATVTQLTQKVLQSSEIRQDKVAALRQAIESGEYKIDAGKIADAMLGDSE
jgi:negative regulator of flagellin synthesis FlgM